MTEISTDTPGSIWFKCLSLLKAKISRGTYSTWFEPLVPLRLEQDLLTVEVPSTYFYEWLEEHFFEEIQTALRDVLGNSAKLQYAVKVQKQSTRDVAEIPLDSISVQDKNNNGKKTVIPVDFGWYNVLNPKYTFENFLKGEGNQFARAAALNVAKNPGATAFNPLVIYGGIGLGKTHLVQSIGNFVMEMFPVKKVLYVSSEKFTVDFVEAIEKNITTDFSNYYRTVDVLIVDDIQFFSGKERTQDMFFHTFNALSQHKKQIILSSDRPPKDLVGLDDRLVSRFQCGLTVDIQPPDLETRIAILRMKAQSDHMEIPPEVIDYIASNVKSNIRELEGCYISLLARHMLEDKPLNIELAKIVVQNVVSIDKKDLTIEQIQKIVADFYHIPENSIRAKTRRQEIVYPRQIAMYLSKNFTRASLKTIGLHFGGRDHSTIIHACKSIENEMKNDDNLNKDLSEIQKRISYL
jgi:chromosomal replication initiator protein